VETNNRQRYQAISHAVAASDKCRWISLLPSHIIDIHYTSPFDLHQEIFQSTYQEVYFITYVHFIIGYTVYFILCLRLLQATSTYALQLSTAVSNLFFRATVSYPFHPQHIFRRASQFTVISLHHFHTRHL